MSETNGTADEATTIAAPPADATPHPGHSPAPWREVGLDVIDADGVAIATV